TPSHSRKTHPSDNPVENPLTDNCRNRERIQMFPAAIGRDSAIGGSARPPRAPPSPPDRSVPYCNHQSCSFDGSTGGDQQQDGGGNPRPDPAGPSRARSTADLDRDRGQPE